MNAGMHNRTRFYRTVRFVGKSVAGLLILLFVFWYRQVIRMIKTHTSVTGEATLTTKPNRFSWGRISTWLGISLLALSLFFGLVRIADQFKPNKEATGLIKRQPNIVLLGTEGLVAKHMSLYGYNRDTTPNLLQLA